MKKPINLFLFVLLFSINYSCNPTIDPQVSKGLSKTQVKEDLKFLDQELQRLSSYQGLNGYNYKKDLDNYSNALKEEPISTTDLGIFLTKTIGKIGDRHSSVRGYDLPNSKFLPFIVAPYDGKVVALSFDKTTLTYDLLFPEFPYLKKIDQFDIEDFLAKIIPEEIAAPKDAYFTRVVKQLKYVERNFNLLDYKIPTEFSFVFTDGDVNEMKKEMPLEEVRSRYITWDEKFSRLAYKEEELNDAKIAKEHFNIDKDNIAYVRLPIMVRPDEVPVFYKTLNEFMETVLSTKALIIDLRSNGGGSRHLMMEMAKYLIPTSATYVVNVAQQRGEIPLNEDWKKDLHNRFLFSINENEAKEQTEIKDFLTSFDPMYDLSKDKFSEFHFTLFKGENSEEYFYKKPVFILLNERSFSAASVFAAAFKNLPNVKLVGVTSDGSSGNSERFSLPNSKLRIRISTMVSFQKDGKILDGFGTVPDIEIKRNLEQVFWKEDFQLKKLKEIIN